MSTSYSVKVPFTTYSTGNYNTAYSLGSDWRGPMWLGLLLLLFNSVDCKGPGSQTPTPRKLEIS